MTTTDAAEAEGSLRASDMVFTATPTPLIAVSLAAIVLLAMRAMISFRSYAVQGWMESAGLTTLCVHRYRSAPVTLAAPATTQKQGMTPDPASKTAT